MIEELVSIVCNRGAGQHTCQIEIIYIQFKGEKYIFFMSTVIGNLKPMHCVVMVIYIIL